MLAKGIFGIWTMLEHDIIDIAICGNDVLCHFIALEEIVMSATSSNKKFKVFLVSYASLSSTDRNTMSIAGGDWVEVGVYPEDQLSDVLKNIKINDWGRWAPTQNQGIFLRTVAVPVP